MIWRIIGIIVLLIAAPFALRCDGAPEAELSMSQQYPPPWSEEILIGIQRALVANKIGGCGQYKYREHVGGTGEYLLHCTRDGEHWLAYLVFVHSGEVMGPYAPDPSLD